MNELRTRARSCQEVEVEVEGSPIESQTNWTPAHWPGFEPASRVPTAHGGYTISPPPLLHHDQVQLLRGDISGSCFRFYGKKNHSHQDSQNLIQSSSYILNKLFGLSCVIPQPRDGRSCRSGC